MKNFELVETGLSPLSENENRDINGGFWQIVLGAAVEEIISDWDNFKRGLAGEPEKKKD
jgi:hypothetical protein